MYHGEVAYSRRAPLPGRLMPFDVSSTIVAGGRVLSLAANFALFGAITFRFLVLPRMWTWRNGKREAGALFRVRRMALGACGLFLVAHVARLVLAWPAIAGGEEGRAALLRLGAALVGSPFGVAWTFATCGLVLALVGLAGTGGKANLGWHGAAAGGMLMAVAAGLSEHAVMASHRLLTVAVASLHVAASASWIGVLLVALVAAMPAAMYDGRGDAPHRSVAELMAAVSPVTLLMAALTVLTGGYAAFRHVPSAEALRASAYGAILVGKLAFTLAAVLLLGWRAHIASRLAGDGAGTRRVALAARAELLLGGLVLAMSAALAHTPIRPE